MLTLCVRFAHAALQGRLLQELSLAGLTDIAAANRFLAETFIPEHNQRFREAPAETVSAFVSWAGRNLGYILCVRQERTVGNDCRYGTRSVTAVRYEQRILQIPPGQPCPHYVKCKVRVHAYPDGSLAVFHGPRCLAIGRDLGLSSVLPSCVSGERA